VRENNEDKFDFYEPEDPTLLAARGALFAVADGMGGHAAGQIASEIALKMLIGGYYDSLEDDIPTALDAAIRQANEQIFSLAQMIRERKEMGTTLTALVFVEDTTYIAHVGDSRAYLIRDEQVRQVSCDHSWIAEQVALGSMTLEEAKFSPYKNVITRSVGNL